jgi:Ser/Thr protein kinase RdoA (MazF antagonist)
MPELRPTLETVRQAAQQFGGDPDDLRLINAGFNTVYRSGQMALRLVNQAYRDLNSLMPPLAWLRHLATAGASVCGPLSTPDGRWIVDVEQDSATFLATAVRWVQGPRLSDLPPTPELYCEYGRSIGRLHRANHNFNLPPGTPHMLEPGAEGVFARWDWLWQRAAGHLGGVQVLEQAFERLTPLVLAWVKEGQTLTHGDLRPGNVIWHAESKRAVIIDFDEPVIGPAALDLARAALELQKVERPALIAALLKGYRLEYELAAVWDARIPALIAARAALMTAWNVEGGNLTSGAGSGAVVSVPRLLERLERDGF